MSLVAPPKPIFRGVVLAVTADIHKGQSGFTEVDVARWVKVWGGRFSPDLDESVTHLLALPQDLEPKNRTARVNSALKRKKLSIVSLDWFEDCFIHCRKLGVANYLLARGGRSIADSTKAKQVRAQKKAAKEQANIEKLAREYIDPRLFHAYIDETCFTYEIVLTRGDNGERYQATLFESEAKPHMYQFGRIYHPTKNAIEVVYYRMPDVPPAGTSFANAFDAFKRFFTRETGVDWDDRVIAFHKGKGNLKGDGFVYELPSGGKPIGLIQGEAKDLDDLVGGGGGGGSESLDGNADASGSGTAVDTVGEDFDDGLAVAAQPGDDIDTDDEDAGTAQATDPLPAVPALIGRTPGAPTAYDDAHDSGVDDGQDAGHHSNMSTNGNVGDVDEGYSSV